MPELPEVEITMRTLAPHVKNATITQCIARTPKLRWPIPIELAKLCNHKKILQLTRRAKYLLVQLEHQVTIIIHLGMSGKLKLLTHSQSKTVEKHDHFDLTLDNGYTVRLNDPRRFGSILVTQAKPLSHKLLINLGPEPLEDSFNAEYLANLAQNKTKNIKNFIMDAKIVVGVGNIYANEALFLSKIHPLTPTSSLTKAKFIKLVQNIKLVLKKSIAKGGTTLKDFADSNGKLGYFAQELQVYGKSGKPCPKCKCQIEAIIIGQRNSFFCKKCQKI